MPVYFVSMITTRARCWRRRAFAALAHLEGSLAFYEAPHRVVAGVRDLAAELDPDGNAGRDIVIARELTKLYESVHRCKLAEAEAWLAADANRQRGEFV